MKVQVTIDLELMFNLTTEMFLSCTLVKIDVFYVQLEKTDVLYCKTTLVWRSIAPYAAYGQVPLAHKEEN